MIFSIYTIFQAFRYYQKPISNIQQSSSDFQIQAKPKFFLINRLYYKSVQKVTIKQMGVDLDFSKYQKEHKLTLSKYHQTQEDELRQFTEPVQTTTVIDLLQMLHTLNERIGRFNTVLFNHGENISIVVRFDDQGQFRQGIRDAPIRERSRSPIRRPFMERQNQVQRNGDNIFSRMFQRNIFQSIRNQPNRQIQRQRQRQRQERQFQMNRRFQRPIDLSRQRHRQRQRQRQRERLMDRFDIDRSRVSHRIQMDLEQQRNNNINRTQEQRLQDSHLNFQGNERQTSFNNSKTQILENEDMVKGCNIPKLKLNQDEQKSQQQGCWTSFKKRVKQCFK